MRKNPRVCFEIDQIKNFFNWQCVVCQGIFEEITEVDEMENALQFIIDKIEPHLSEAEDAHPAHGITNNAHDIGDTKELVVYKINLLSKSGRFEARKTTYPSVQEH